MNRVNEISVGQGSRDERGREVPKGVYFEGKGLGIRGQGRGRIRRFLVVNQGAVVAR